MRSDFGCNCVNSRAICICVGTITTFLWLAYAYAMATNIHPITIRNGDTDYMVTLQTPVIAALICILTSSAMSALMVFGAIKRNAGYMFPWLAIHFVLLAIGISLSISFILVIVITIDNSVQKIFLSLAMSILITSTLIYIWRVVYQYYKQLNARVQVEPICNNEGKILKTPNEPKNPYYPV